MPQNCQNTYPVPDFKKVKEILSLTQTHNHNPTHLLERKPKILLDKILATSM